MESSPAQSPMEIAAANLRVIWLAVLAGLGTWGIAPARQAGTYNWISGKFRAFEQLLMRYRAGRLRAYAPRKAAMSEAGPGEAGPGRVMRNPPAFRVSRKWAWLVLTGKHHAACYGSQLQHCVLNTPELAELLATVPQARRILRPLLRALAVDLPWTADQPRAVPKPRVRKPRPARPVYPEDARIRWQRGEKTWSRKEKIFEKALKVKQELLLKMGTTRPW